MDEEAQKRNTDCVYFLASPLTCKKGNECEYRHSESARINPRDCWYWLGGKCLNPTCAFRHPPLDGLSGASASIPAPAQAQLPVSLPTSGIGNKPRVPCYYFSQGYCAKAEKCPFMHGPLSGGNLTSQKLTKATATVPEPQSSGKRTFNGSENTKDGKRSSPSSASDAVQLPPETKPIVQVQPSQLPLIKGSRHAAEPIVPETDSTRARVPDAPITTVNLVNRSRVRQAQPPDDRLQNGMEAEEWLGESSPGFDVLVDDGPEQLSYREDAGYLSSHDIESGRGPTRGRERNMQNARELIRFDYDQPNAHERSGYFDAEFQYDRGAYDSYKRGYDHVSRQQPIPFDDRAPQRPVVRERRALDIEEDLEQSNVEDLRHRISKRRRVDGARVGDSSGSMRQHIDTRLSDFHRGRKQRDDEHRHPDVIYRDRLSQQSVSHNNRRLPGRMLAEAGGFKRESFDDEEADCKGSSDRVRLKSSPGRRGSSNHLKNRYREKERGRIPVEPAALSESRISRNQNLRNNEARTDAKDFAGPKTLAQIKEEKLRESSEEPISSVQSGLHGAQNVSMKSQVQRSQNPPVEERKIRLGNVVTHESKKADPGFEGPKPLSAILKAKRKADPGKDTEMVKSHKEQADQKTHKEQADQISQGLDLSGNTESSGRDIKASLLSPGSEKEVEEGELPQGDCYTTEPATVSQISQTVEDFEASNGVDAFIEDKSSLPENGTLLRVNNQVEDTIMTEPVNNLEDEDANNEDEDVDRAELQEGGEWGRDGDEEEDYLEDDDEDDFARKLGGIFS